MQVSQNTLNLQLAYSLHAGLAELLHQSAMVTCERSVVGHYTRMATCAAGSKLHVA